MGAALAHFTLQGPLSMSRDSESTHASLDTDLGLSLWDLGFWDASSPWIQIGLSPGQEESDCLGQAVGLWPLRLSDGMYELVDEALRDVRFADDPFLVILADGAT